MKEIFFKVLGTSWPRSYVRFGCTKKMHLKFYTYGRLSQMGRPTQSYLFTQSLTRSAWTSGSTSFGGIVNTLPFDRYILSPVHLGILLFPGKSRMKKWAKFRISRDFIIGASRSVAPDYSAVPGRTGSGPWPGIFLTYSAGPVVFLRIWCYRWTWHMRTDRQEI